MRKKRSGKTGGQRKAKARTQAKARVRVKKRAVGRGVAAKKRKATAVPRQRKGRAPVARQAKAMKAKIKAKTGMPAPRLRRASLQESPFDVKPYRLKKGEAYMNEAQREHFRRILRVWRQDLMEEVDRTMHHMQDDAANFPDPVDRASQEEEFNLELRTRDRERKLIKKIEEASAQLDNGTYGYCVDCGAEIGLRRLEARPTAMECIECKTISEIREKQVGTGE